MMLPSVSPSSRRKSTSSWSRTSTIASWNVLATFSERSSLTLYTFIPVLSSFLVRSPTVPGTFLCCSAMPSMTNYPTCRRNSSGSSSTVEPLEANGIPSLDRCSSLPPDEIDSDFLPFSAAMVCLLLCCLLRGVWLAVFLPRNVPRTFADRSAP